MSFAAAQYQAATVETASPVQIVVRLYDAAVRNLVQAATALESKDAKTRADRLRKAHAIVSELQASLIHSHAPDLCVDLDRLYEYVLFAITEANTKGQREHLDASVRVLRELRSAWAELAKRG